MADILQQARDFYDEAKDAWAEQFERMREDLRFSNPANPEQWTQLERLSRQRSDRPCLVFDHTNQYIFQVVNSGRRNKPAIKVVAVDSGADVDAAQQIEGMIRHIEYQSRAAIAYDTSLDWSSRTGLGFIRVYPEVINQETGEQEIRIGRVHDALSVLFDPYSLEPDGSDAQHCSIEGIYSAKEFERKWGKKAARGADRSGWFNGDSLRVCEYFYKVETQQNNIVIQGPEGDKTTVTEDEYWKLAQQIGFKPNVVANYTTKKTKVMWMRHSGDEVLEETEFPSEYLGIVPVIGCEVFVDEKRYLSGLVRSMMDSQKAYNVSRTADIELAMAAPKQPWLVDWRSVNAYKDYWAQANQPGMAYLPFDSWTEDGRQLPIPVRTAGPQANQAYAMASQAALADMEASIGLHAANLGAKSNETSGRAINARKEQGETASFHYIDNLGRSIEQVGRIVLQMIPKIYDTARQAKILGLDGNSQNINIDPEMPQAVAKKGSKVIAINPNVGKYDVRVTVGPSYTTQRQEAAEGLQQIMQGNPQFVPVLGPVWAKLQDLPDSDKISKLLMTMAPPAAQEVMNGEADIPPQLKVQMDQMQQTIQQLSQALENAHQEVESNTMDAQVKLELARMQAEKDIQIAQMNNEGKLDVEELKGMVQMLVQQMIPPPQLINAVDEDLQESETENNS